MAKQNINVGTAANDKKGDSLRAAFQKVNANFTELYTELGLVNDVTLSLGAFEFAGSTISTTDSTAIVIDQATTVTSNLSVGGDILPQTANGGDLGSSTLPWRSLYVSNNTIFIGGVPLGIDANGNLTVNSSPVTGGGVSSYAQSGATSAYATQRVLQYNPSTNAVTYSNYIDATSIYITGYSSEIHVSPVAYDDSGKGTIGDPVKTIARAQALAALAFETTGAGQRKSIILHPGDYVENVTISTQYTVLTTHELVGKNTTLSGTLTITTGCTIDGLKMTNLVISATSATGSVDIIGCTVTTATTKTSTAYTVFRGCDLSTSTMSITGGGTTALIGGNYFTLAVNNAAAGVLVKTVITMGPVTLTAGTLQLSDTLIYSATNTSYAITQSAGSVITINNCQTLRPTLDNVSRISLNGFYSILSAVYDKPNSILVALSGTGGSLSSIIYDQYINADRLILASGGQITFPDATVQTTAWTGFSVAADDSTQRLISSDEVIKFIGAGGITTASDAEGNITITGSGGSVSSLVNGAYTVSLGSTGTLTVPANGIITAPINQEFQLQAKDTNSVLRNEINLDPNNGTYMSVWSDETTSFSSANWGSGSWNNEGGLGAARFTNAQALQNFWTTGIGSTVSGIEVSINGGARSPNVFYENNNGGGYGVYLGLDAVPPGGQGTTVAITSLVFYYRLQSKINMDVTGNEILVDAQAMDLDLRTTLNLDLRANENLNLRGLGAYPVRIYTNGTTHMWEFDNTGSLTLPSVGKISNGAYDWTFGTSGDLTIPGDIKGTANTSIIVDNVVLFANVTVEQAQPYGPSGSRVFISESAYPTLGSIVQVGDTVTIGWGTPITVTITNITGGGFWELRFNQIITAELILNPGTITITSAQVNTWTFDNDGGLTFPDGTVQTTAWTGTFSTLSVTGSVTAERFNTDQITVVGNRISTTVTNANLELECNGSGGVVINAIADATTASTVKSVGYLGLPQSATATSGTLAISDAGKHIYVTTAGQTIAIPDNSLVAYPIGTTLTFIAGPSATTVLIVINTDTLRLAGSSSTGTRTLAANGMATAVKVASTLWYINGTGLT